MTKVFIQTLSGPEAIKLTGRWQIRDGDTLYWGPVETCHGLSA